MLRKLTVLSFVTCLMIHLCGAITDWSPPSLISRSEILKASEEVLAMPDIPVRVREDLFRIRVLEMDWDIGARVYEPEDPAKIPVGPDGKKVGIFMIHGGTGDHRSKSVDDPARLLASKYGFKVTSMSYPGRLYLLDPSRDWPGDTVNSDGTVRTPIWSKDELITSDQYEVVEDKSRRERTGTSILACAREGTDFYHRMASWPVAFEEAAKDLMGRHLPVDEYSIYIYGHSTGGLFAFMLSQRVSHIVGVIGMETSSFGSIYSRQIGIQWEFPFQCLTMYTWRLSAMYHAGEVLKLEGPQALRRLPMLIEEVFERWSGRVHNAHFKAENMIHLNGVEALTEAARVTAQRLNLSHAETESLIERYIGYTRELSGETVKPVPPILFASAKFSSGVGFEETVLPAFAAMEPTPKVRRTRVDGGFHDWTRPEPDLPLGMAPAVVKLWYEAIMGGYYQE
jgi:pimeloyl-ACP methyl ester carboxylesterase